MGEDEKCIYLPAPKGRIYPQEYEEDILATNPGISLTYEDQYPDGKCPVDKGYIGVRYFRTKEDAEKKIVLPPPTLTEPSDEEKETWSDITKNYVETLKLAWDGYYQQQLNKYNYAIGKGVEVTKKD